MLSPPEPLPLTTMFQTAGRVQLVLPPVVPDGTVSITVRKPSTKTMTMADVEASGMFSETKVATKRVSPVGEKLLGLIHACRHSDFFALAVQRRPNLLIPAASPTGKTTYSPGPTNLHP